MLSKSAKLKVTQNIEHYRSFPETPQPCHLEPTSLSSRQSEATRDLTPPLNQ